LLKVFSNIVLWSLYWRDKWQNQDADAKWAAKKDVPAGKFDIKKAGSE
jgi:hypothetical protein